MPVPLVVIVTYQLKCTILLTMVYSTSPPAVVMEPEPAVTTVDACFLVDVYIGLCIRLLAVYVGILHVYPAPAERIALNRPMLTDEHLQTQ